MESHWKPRAKRDLVTYGRRVQAVIKYREISGGSNVWGPWKEAPFPNNGHFEEGGRKAWIANQIIADFLVRGGWINDTKVFVDSLKRQRVLTAPLISELLKKDVSIRDLLLRDFKQWKEEEKDGLQQV